MTVKRYTLNGDRMFPHSEGRWVFGEDHDTLAARHEEVCASQIAATREAESLAARLAEAERAIKAHNDSCQDRCGRGDQEAVACKYRPYFVNSGRRCPTCPTHEMIDYAPDSASVFKACGHCNGTGGLAAECPHCSGTEKTPDQPSDVANGP